MMHSHERPIGLLTVDTEEEWDWNGPFPAPPCATRNIAEVPIFQALCRAHEVRPTYFVDQAVVDDTEARALLAELFHAGHCDIGAHLHPWCTPPYSEPRDERHSHAVNLPAEVFAAKMSHLTDCLIEAFGEHPLSFRSGRWGMNGRMLAQLADLGYCIDSSVRPYYRDRDFDYHGAPAQPYWPDFDALLEENDQQRRLLELPVTAGFTHSNFEQCQAWHDRAQRPLGRRLRAPGILWRLGLLRPITATPEGFDASDLCRLFDACITRGHRVINLFFHSSDLLPGATPYVRSQADRDRFLDTLARCLEHLRTRHEVEFLTVRDYARRVLPQPLQQVA